MDAAVPTRSTRPLAIVATAALLVGTMGLMAPSPARAASFSIAPGAGSANGGTEVLVTTPPTIALSDVSAGNGFSVAIGADGAAYAWGNGSEGRLGNGSNIDRSTPTHVTMPSGVTFTSVDAGDGHTLAIGSDGATYAWGAGAQGRLGNGATAYSSTPVTVTLPAGVTFTSVSAGGSHSLALGDDGKTYAWGSGIYGQLGDRLGVSSSVPVVVETPAGVAFTSVVAGFGHSLAIGDDGKVYAWGFNSWGQVGDGSDTSPLTPVAVALPVGPTYTGVDGGSSHSLALDADGVAYAWGQNQFFGQLGDGTNGNSLLPVIVSRPSGVTFTSIGAGGFSSRALGSDGRVYGWGENASGEIGDGTTVSTNIPTPAAMPAGVTATSITAGSSITVAFGSDGETYAWGAGVLSPATVTVPVAVTGVRFDGSPGSGLAVSGAGYRVTTPAHTAGVVDVTLEWTLGGGAQAPLTLIGGFTFINPPPTWSLAAPSFQAGEAIDETYTAPYHAPWDWTGGGTITVSGLPDGVVAEITDSVDGPPSVRIHGTPTTPGAYTAQIVLTDDTGTTYTVPWNDTVAPPAPHWNLPAPELIAGIAFDQTFTVPSTAPWDWTGGGDIDVAFLPSGLEFEVLDADVPGTPPRLRIFGTPTSPGWYYAELKLRDGAGTEFSVVWNEDVISLWDLDAPELEQDQPFDETYTAPVAAPWNWSNGGTISVSGLPDGLVAVITDTIDGPPSVRIHGTPTTPGDYTALITVSDGVGTSVVITWDDEVEPPAARWDLPVPVFAEGVPFDQTFTPPLTSPWDWSDGGDIDVDDLPDGLQYEVIDAGVPGIPPSLRIYGTPTWSGPYYAEIEVWDYAEGNDATVEWDGEVLGPWTLDDVEFTVGTPVDVTYAAPVRAPWDWTDGGTIDVDGLPAGLVAEIIGSSIPGVAPQVRIHGTPTTAGDSVVDVTLTDGAGTSYTVEWDVSVTAPVPTWNLPTPSFVAGTPVDDSHTAPSTLPWDWSDGGTITVDGLPAGLAAEITTPLVGPPTVRIHGTPTTPGSYTAEITLSDQYGNSHVVTWTGTVGAAARELELTLDLQLGEQVAGAQAVASAAGLEPGTGYDIVVRSTPQTLATGTVGGAGTVARTVTLPALSPGWHSLTFTGTWAGGGAAVAVLWLQVGTNGALLAVSTTAPGLALTGQSLGLDVTAGFLLVAGGLVLLAVRTRRRPDTTV